MTARCELCGEPMPAGEDMFKYHGYSGPCPKPPLQKTQVVAEYIFRDTRDGEFWIDVKIDRQHYWSLGPYASEVERQRAHDDLVAMTRQLGAKDFPTLPQ